MSSSFSSPQEQWQNIPQPPADPYLSQVNSPYSYQPNYGQPSYPQIQQFSGYYPDPYGGQWANQQQPQAQTNLFPFFPPFFGGPFFGGPFFGRPFFGPPFFW